jgi:predicted Rossmann fold nucleotide-binding protein DprA/Smf involved in DNA uptake
MVNEGKQQMSMFAAPAAITSEPRPEPKVEPRPEPKVEPIKGFSPAEIAILDAMRKGAEHIDEIIQESGLNAGTVAGVLLMMELGGHIKQKPGRYFARA